MQLPANDLLSRTKHGHCTNDHLNETCEKFYQIWSHKATNLSNDLIEYTIRRLQTDRLRILCQIRNDFTHKEHILPICQMSSHMEDDLQRIKEYIRRFCLTTRNLYRHLRSDSRIYPKMCIDIDQGLMIKICRFIFKTKVLIKIFSTEKHLSEQQRDEIKKHKANIHDPYINITKAFVVLQSNFEILFGDILERDFLQNAKTGFTGTFQSKEILDCFLAVQTLPIVLDTSKTIRLIFCALYKLTESERHAEAEAIRQRRLAFFHRGCELKKSKFSSMHHSNHKNQERNTLKTVNDLLKSQVTETPIETSGKTFSTKNISNRLKPEEKENSKNLLSPKSQSRTSNTKSKSSGNHLSPSSHKRKSSPSKNSSTSLQKKQSDQKNHSSKHKKQKKSKNKNKNASSIDSCLTDKHTKNTISVNNNNTTIKFNSTNSNPSRTSSEENDCWTTWLKNATMNLDNILPDDLTKHDVDNSKPLLITWASLDRVLR